MLTDIFLPNTFMCQTCLACKRLELLYQFLLAKSAKTHRLFMGVFIIIGNNILWAEIPFCYTACTNPHTPIVIVSKSSIAIKNKENIKPLNNFLQIIFGHDSHRLNSEHTAQGNIISTFYKPNTAHKFKKKYCIHLIFNTMSEFYWIPIKALYNIARRITLCRQIHCIADLHCLRQNNIVWLP